MTNKLPQQPKIFLENLIDFPVRDVRKKVSLLELLKDEELHGKILWDRINALAQANETQLPRIIGQIDLLNVAHPERIGEPHSLQVASQLRAVLTDNRFGKWYSKYPREVYEAIIEDLEVDGDLAKYVNEVEKARAILGIATPIPLIGVMENVKKVIGDSNSVWTVDTIRDISSFLRDKSLTEMDKFYPTDYVFTTTGFGRNQTFEAVKPFIHPDGTYVEVGSSLGIYAVDVKQALEFRQLITTDIMSESQAKSIVSVTDFQKGGDVPYTKEHRKKVEKEINIRLWRHNILKDKIAPHVSEKNGFFCFGFPNVLVHLIDKDIAIRNATEGMIKPDDVIWVSGGYCANSSIFPNLLYQKTSKGAETFLINNNHAVPMDSLNSVTKAVRKGRKNN